MEKYIVHIDMDAFFAAIEQRDDSSLRGKPVIVGADPQAGRGRGVVSTASYEARKLGIGSAMPIAEAYRRCPGGVFLRPRMSRYNQVWQNIYAILVQFSPLVEPVSIDEAFLDISNSFPLFGNPAETCLKLKKKILEETGLTASVGLAPVKMAAKIASDLSKPDGFYQVEKKDLLKFLAPLGIEKLWGVGKKSQKILNSIGITKIKDLARADKEKLKKIFGKNGGHLWELAQGIDRRQVELPEEAKSISNELTFSRDTSDYGKIEPALSKLSEQVSTRLKKQNLRAKNISLKIRLANFSTHSRTMRLVKATNFYQTIYEAAKKLCYGFGFGDKKIRLVGVKAENLIPEGLNDSLFQEAGQAKKEKMDQAVEKIRTKFGQNSIWRGGSL